MASNATGSSSNQRDSRRVRVARDTAGAAWGTPVWAAFRSRRRLLNTFLIDRNYAAVLSENHAVLLLQSRASFDQYLDRGRHLGHLGLQLLGHLDVDSWFPGLCRQRTINQLDERVVHDRPCPKLKGEIGHLAAPNLLDP